MLQRTKIRLGFLCAFILLAGMTGSVFWAVSAYGTQAGWVEHTQEVQRRLERVQALLTDVESGSRGYVITGNPAFLDPYRMALGVIDGELSTLDRLVSDNPRQQEDLARLHQAVQDKISQSRRSAELRAADTASPLDRSAAAREVQSQRGRIAMDRAREILERMHRHEDELLVRRRTAAATGARLAVAALIAGAGLQVALLAWVFRVMAMAAAVEGRIAAGLAESEERYRSLVASSDAAIVTVDAQGDILSWNPSARRIFGHAAEEAVGRSLTLIIPERLRAGHLRGFAAASASGEGRLLGTTIELPGLHRDGHEVPISLSLSTWTSGGRRFFSGIILDISGRKRIEDERARLALMLESTSDFVSMADTRGRVLYHNAAFRRVCGIGAEGTLQDLRIPDVHPPWAMELVGREGLPTAVRDGSWTGETAINDPDGREIPVSQLIICHKDPDGQPVYFFTIMRDMTERKRIEADLRAARDLAEAGDRAKSDFLATMSHEIRTPMNGVIGMTGLLLDTALSMEQRGMVDTVRACADSLLTIIDDILDFSKIEAGKLALERIPFDPRSIIEDAAVLLAERAQAKGLELITEADPAVPATVLGDPGRLRQVLVNLVGNAVKFTAAGEVVVRLAAVGSGDADAAGMTTLEIAVSDTGIGISPGDQARLFQPFIQADASTTRRFGGTGLGLAICSRLVGLMGGSIAIDSAPERGSTFRVRVRVGPGTPADASGLPGSAGLRALVIDDNAACRAILAGRLAAWGLRCVEAADGAAGVEILRAARAAGDPVRIALIDQGMPRMDGNRVARAIRDDDALDGTAVVLLTPFGHGGVPDGVSGCLAKPVRQAHLLQLLRQILDGPPAGAAAAAPASAAPRIAGHVLVAEDNAVNQQVTRALLARLGCTVEVVASGHEALLRLDETGFDLVLMDCQMPDLDGYEATRAWRRREIGRGGHLPVVAMTANAMQGDRERCLAAGMDDYLTKPVRREELERILGRWLRPDGQGPEQAPGPDTAFDRRTLDALRAELGAGPELAAIVRSFRDELPPLIADLARAAAAGDEPGIRHLALRLKTSARAVGAIRLAAHSSHLVLLPGARLAAEAPALARAVAEAFAAVQARVAAYDGPHG